MSSTSLQSRLRSNSFKTCQAPGCSSQRSGLRLWCRTHLRLSNAYGHPDAKPLQGSLWATQRAEVSKLFADQSTHPGLLQANRWLSTLMTQAAANERAFKGAEEIARLGRAGVKPEALLVEACALHLWVTDTGHRWPTDLAADFAMSRAVFALAPRPRTATKGVHGTWGRPTTTPQSYSAKAKRSALAYVGGHFRECLAPLMVTVASAVQAQRAVKVDPQALQRLPFAIRMA